MMTIRNFEQEDRAVVLEMVGNFYNSPGVLHRIPVKNFEDAFGEMCGGGSNRLRGLLVEDGGQPAGFVSLAFTYSTEAGGEVVLIEEVYIKPEFRGKGFGSSVFELLKGEYHGKAARLRLEVAPDNTRAIALYEHLGFEALPYVQMIHESF